MTRFPVFGTYYICLSHHVLTWNYSSCVSCISHLWWDTFKLAVWYWFASWIWFLACIASSLMNATYDETILTWQSDIDCTFHMVSCSVSNFLKCLFGTYYICLSHHVLTWNYSSCVSCISHLWWDTFKLAVWYWFASWIWFLACIASSLMNATYDETILTWQSDIDCTFHMVSCSVSNFLKCPQLSYHIIGVNMSSHPFFRTYSILVSCTFHMVSCSVSNLLKCLLLSYHIIGVNMSSHSVFRTYSILVSWLCLSSE